MSEPDAWASALSPVHREPLSIAVARRLRAAILSGALTVGSPLPSEHQLGQQLGVGRSTIREALRILQAQGLVSGGDRVSTRGSVVGGRTVPVAIDALQTLLQLGDLPQTDLVQLRRLLETTIVVRVIRRLDDPDLSLDDVVAAAEQCRSSTPDPEAFVTADIAFHCALAHASGNQAFALVMRVLRGAMQSALRESLAVRSDLPGMLTRLADEHDSIVAAIVARDETTAVHRMHAHLDGFYGRGERP